LEVIPARYNARVITRGIREFVGREWRVVRQAKDEYWAARIARLGAFEGLRPADRHLDMLAHVRLAELFARASSARGR
jgi:hypothetical protein